MLGIFDHDFRRTLITWSNHSPIHQVPDFSSDIANAKHAHISHIALLPYNFSQKPIFIPTNGHVVLDHQNKSILIVGNEEFHNSYQPRCYKNLLFQIVMLVQACQSPKRPNPITLMVLQLY